MRTLIELALSWIIGVTLVISAMAHLGNGYDFLDAVMQYGLLPGPLAWPVAVFAPFLQLVVAFCLIGSVKRKAAFRLALLMFVGFAMVQSYAWLTGLGIPCGCFGASDAPIGPFSLGIVYSMLILSLLGNVLAQSAKRKEQSGGTSAGLVALILLASGSQTLAQELQYPPDSREESARLAVGAMFRHLERNAKPGLLETPEAIVETLTKQGLFSQFFAAGRLGDLKRADEPVLLLFRNDWSSLGNARWVLLLDIAGNQAKVVDPAVSEEVVTISTAELLARWDGRGLYVSREPISLNRVRFANFFKMLPIAVFLFFSWLVYDTRKKRAKTETPVLREIAMLVGLTLLLGTLYHLATPTGLLRNTSAGKIVVGRFETSIAPELSLDETRQRMANGPVLLLDTRTADKFAEGTIPGAVNFPVDASPEERETLLADVPREMPIILFCKSNRCPYAESIANFLRHNGYENLAIFRDGFVEWK